MPKAGPEQGGRACKPPSRRWGWQLAAPSPARMNWPKARSGGTLPIQSMTGMDSCDEVWVAPGCASFAGTGGEIVRWPAVPVVSKLPEYYIDGRAYRV